jgi:hypothetical protein
MHSPIPHSDLAEIAHVPAFDASGTPRRGGKQRWSGWVSYETADFDGIAV